MNAAINAWTALIVSLTAAHAFSDATTIARAHSEAFGRACAAGNIPAVVALFEDDATVIWPGQGAETRGKLAIRGLATRLCGAADTSPLVLKSVEGQPLGDGSIVTTGRWEMTTQERDGERSVAEIVTTEVLRRTDGHWRDVIDHTSIDRVPTVPAGAER